ncbi:MAG: 16S rRNA (cytidine(1402)-2'-O)-methyltransferase [Actinobacteria bacterium]|nr:16S rRNA (cytidine(1402)-2'-O)-methyltransferase [Actinomycetota bacterium]MBO0836398.1 16S rRNA (cytidine(1402)-2'-O)-methyltransferase [Actinomycetota bacterium]
MESARPGPASARSAGGGPGGPGPEVTAGLLTVAAAPIGHPADASARLAPALASAGLIAAEDTRRLRRLAADLGVRLTARLVSYYDDVEARRVPSLLAELMAGHDVLLVTDAGLPGVSDPGYRLIAAAADAGIRVTVLPGPSAVTTALVVSGLPSDRFVFDGFPSRRSSERARRFAELAAERRTLVFFESPRRIGATLAELVAAFGADRRAAVCRELTKTHEEVLRGTLAELAGMLAGGTLGEVTLVVAGAPEPAEPVALADAVTQVHAQVQDGVTTRDAVSAVAAATGLRKRDLYNAAAAKEAHG